MNKKQSNISDEDISKLAKAFKWLIGEYQKQNPHLLKSLPVSRK